MIRYISHSYTVKTEKSYCCIRSYIGILTNLRERFLLSQNFLFEWNNTIWWILTERTCGKFIRQWVACNERICKRRFSHIHYFLLVLHVQTTPIHFNHSEWLYVLNAVCLFQHVSSLNHGITLKWLKNIKEMYKTGW